jgi:signal peptidase I
MIERFRSVKKGFWDTLHHMFFKKWQITYSLRRSRYVFREGIRRLKKLQKKQPGSSERREIEQELDSLHEAMVQRNKISASDAAKRIESILKLTKKSYLQHLLEFLFALVVAICAAGVIRQMWFEPYEIPSGSMRTTFEEGDRVFVSKNTFGINFPFRTKHISFDPHLLNEGNIIVFSGDGIDLPDTDTMYFWIFPGKKRYVKRCMGSPGDTLYFYGGNIYALDKNGREKRTFLEDPTFCHIEHIPFITFDGKVVEQKDPQTSNEELVFKHMNIPVGKIVFSQTGAIESTSYTSRGWQKDPKAFGQLWGLENFAMARLMQPEDLFGIDTGSSAKLYVELRHHPSLYDFTQSSPVARKRLSRTLLDVEKSYIPLDSEHIERIKASLYTARFFMRGGKAYRYNHEDSRVQTNQGIPLHARIPDGTYEFSHGVAYEIGWGGIAKKLDPSHPIYPQTDEELKALFNSGIDFSPFTYNVKLSENVGIFPYRYAYFRDGDFYLLGHPIFSKNESILEDFVKKELEKQQENSAYKPFTDSGAPVLQDGSINKEFMNSFGLHIPDHHYLALGDNHAMSLDSRFFGFVPQENIQGSVTFIVWPIGSRWGIPPQPAIPFFRIENAYTFGAASLLLLLSYLFLRYETSTKTYLRVRNKASMSSTDKP